MPKTSSLEVREEPVVAAEEQEEVSQVSPAMAKGVADLIVMFTTRLDELASRLERVEQAAHISHDFSIGEVEIQAIAHAVLPHVNKHLGISGHPARGDQG